MEDYGPEEEPQTLRDYFAARAMVVAAQFIRSDYESDDKSFDWDEYDLEMVAENAYLLADAMLKERAKVGRS